MKKVLLFYTKAGGGHIRAAEAVAEEILGTSEDIEIVLHDGFEKLNNGQKFNMERAFLLFSTKLLFVYNFFYILTDNRIGVAIFRFIVKLLWGKSIKRIIDHHKPDLIVSFHWGISPKTISSKIRSVPFVIVCTDLAAPHQFWIDSNASSYIFVDIQTTNYFKKLYPELADKMLAIGYPLSKKFIESKSSNETTNNILITSGGAGAGSIVQQVRTISAAFANKKITVVCGSNKRLEKKLHQMKLRNLDIHGFVDSMPDLIANSDLVLTKAGPASIIEATILHKPLIITQWIGMQEKSNVEFVERNKIGIYCPDTKRIPEVINEVYKDYATYSKISIPIQNGTGQISQYLLNLT